MNIHEVMKLYHPNEADIPLRISASGSDSWGKSPMIRQPPINRLIDKTLALDEPRKRVILRLLYSLYSIHNRKSQIAAKKQESFL